MALSTTYNPNAPAATTGQGSAVSNREDLSNLLVMLEPEETPLLSLCEKGKASSTFVEWTADKLRSPSTAGVSEGDDVTNFNDKGAARARLGNYVQKWREPYRVSDFQQAVNSVGPMDIAQAETKAVSEVKRDIEATLCSDNDRSVEDGAGTPYKLRGLGDWLDASGPTDVPSDYRTPAGSIHSSGTFTQTVLNTQVSSIFSQNGKSNSLTLIAGVALRRTVAEFTRSEGTTTATPYTINQDATSRTITLAVDLFQSDFGMVRVVNGNPDCMPDANRGYLVNPKYLGFKTLIPLGTKRLENQGGGDRGFVDCTGTFLCKHPAAHGKITVIS